MAVQFLYGPSQAIPNSRVLAGSRSVDKVVGIFESSSVNGFRKTSPKNSLIFSQTRQGDRKGPHFVTIPSQIIRRVCMTIEHHIVELQKRHELLDQAIATETQSPSSDDLQVTELKRQKLRLKEEIERLSGDAQAA